MTSLDTILRGSDANVISEYFSTLKTASAAKLFAALIASRSSTALFG
jgi:hypothetical protein